MSRSCPHWSDFALSSRHPRALGWAIDELLRSRSSPQPPYRRTDGAARPLRGRDRELQLLEDFLRVPAKHHNALLLAGERGSGKSALLDRVGTGAGEVTVARARGHGSAVQGGATVLDQLLDAVSDHGTGSVAPPPDEERLLLATSVLRDVLRAAAGRPLLLVVDDLHLADPLSTFVCAFVARRLRGTRAGFLGALSPLAGEQAPWDWATSHRLGLLPPAACAELLDHDFPGMADSVRHRVLAEGHGNPARLLEVAASLSEEQLLGLRRLPEVPGVPVRMEDGSEAAVDSLPAPTLKLLLLAAVEAKGDIRAVRAAAAQEGLGLNAFAAAEKAHLVTLDVRTQTVVFTDPAVRAAVLSRATARERRAAHRRLAKAAAGQDPEREAWHRAEALDGPDGTVALELDRLARRALAIGDRHTAVDMLLKASEVAASASHRSDLLALAAHVRSRSQQDRTDVPSLTVRSDRPPPDGPLSTATAAYLSLTEGLDPEEVFQFVLDGIADAGPLPAEDPELVELCYILLSCGLLAASPSLWRTYREVLHRMAPELPEALRILSDIAPDVARIDQRSLQDLDDALDQVSLEGDPYAVLSLGIAAFPVDRLGQCRDALWHLAHTSVTGGPALAAAVEAKLRLCLDDTTTGQWDEALDLAAEGVPLCDRNGLDVQGQTFRLCQALVAACRGDHETAAALAATLSAWALPRGVHLVELQSAYARTLSALGSGDFESAYQQASSISEPGTLAPYNGQAVWVCLDLVEAAVHTDRLPEAVAHTRAILASSIPHLSPRLAQRAATAQALTATDDEEAAGHFERALAVSGADRWVFDTARTQLLYGERLRRTSDATLARAQLSSSLVRFRALGADPWTARAAAGLRAAGVPSLPEGPDTGAVLTARELTIASMAASGLTNKEIGSQLFLSHRTVASLLYKVFPKLGVTTRAALRDALEAAAAAPGGRPAPGDSQMTDGED